jgi:hypothetical protein
MVSEILALNKLPGEIRDDCRNNHKCPRQILVEISRKTQERSMISLYNKYKEEGLTVGELRKTRQPHQQKTELEIVENSVKSLAAMNKKIAALELSTLDGEERTRLFGEISALSSELESRLNAIASRLKPAALP